MEKGIVALLVLALIGGGAVIFMRPVADEPQAGQVEDAGVRFAIGDLNDPAPGDPSDEGQGGEAGAAAETEPGARTPAEEDLEALAEELAPESTPEDRALVAGSPEHPYADPNADPDDPYLSANRGPSTDVERLRGVLSQRTRSLELANTLLTAIDEDAMPAARARNDAEAIARLTTQRERLETRRAALERGLADVQSRLGEAEALEDPGAP